MINPKVVHAYHAFQVARECKIAFYTCDMKRMMYLKRINGRLSGKVHSESYKIAKGKGPGEHTLLLFVKDGF